MVANQWFDVLKEAVLSKLHPSKDKSPKGSIDTPIIELINYINRHKDFVTSSSCSGRITLFCSRSSKGSHIKKGGEWLLSEHCTITMSQLQRAMDRIESVHDRNMVVFKHEPFILHVICRDIEAARMLCQLGIACGFAESGITLGKKNKVLCAIRTTSNVLEVPLASAASGIMVDERNLSWLVDLANEKFVINEKQVAKLTAAVIKDFALINMEAAEKAIPSMCVREVPVLSAQLRRFGCSLIYHNHQLIVYGGQGLTLKNTYGRLGGIEIIQIDVGGSSYQIKSIERGSKDIHVARTYHSATLFEEKEVMIIFGGRESPMKPSSDTLVFDLRTYQWSSIKLTQSSERPSARWGHVACMIGSKLYIHGGRDDTRVFSDLWVLDLATFPDAVSWQQLHAVLDCACFNHIGAAVVEQKKLLFWGGLASLAGDEAFDGNPHTIYIFEIESNTFHQQRIGSTHNGPHSIRFGACSSIIHDETSGYPYLIIIGGVGCTRSSNSLTKIPYFLLDLEQMQWSMLEIHSQYDGSTLVHSACVSIPGTSNIYIVGGGYQCFGFGQVYASTLACELRISRSSEIAKEAGSCRSDATLTSRDEKLLGLVVDRCVVKTIKTMLEAANLYDKTRRVHQLPDCPDTSAKYLVPVICKDSAALRTLEELALERRLSLIEDTSVVKNKFGVFSGFSRNERIRSIISEYAQKNKVSSSIIMRSISERFEYMSDVLLLPRSCCTGEIWDSFSQEMYASICQNVTPALTRVARKAFIDTSEKRNSHVKLLFATAERQKRSTTSSFLSDSLGWVEVRENGIKYGFDITKVMFSSGNVSEKARMGAMQCKGEVIVDLFCGIGYYVLPFLVHGQAQLVYACDWNPDAIAALRYNLEQNQVADRCVICEGDNQNVPKSMEAVADRVNLGLLPSSENAWPIAVKVLKHSGGWLHVHGNVLNQEKNAWVSRVVDTIQALSKSKGKNYIVKCAHLEKVKSYAPKVCHYVADIHCMAI